MGVGVWELSGPSPLFSFSGGGGLRRAAGDRDRVAEALGVRAQPSAVGVRRPYGLSSEWAADQISLQLFSPRVRERSVSEKRGSEKNMLGENV